MKYLVLLLLVGCQPDNTNLPDMVSKHGAKIWFNKDYTSSWTIEQVNAQEDFYLDGIASLNDARFTPSNIAATMSSVEATIFGGPWACSNSPTGLCNGQEYRNIIYIRDMGCPYASAYTHEMLHWLLEWRTGNTDYYHTLKKFWAVADAHAAQCPSEDAGIAPPLGQLTQPEPTSASSSSY